MTDVELLEKKLAFIEICVRELRQLGWPERIEYDIREQRFIAYTLQIAIQAALDIASHIVSSLSRARWRVSAVRPRCGEKVASVYRRHKSWHDEKESMMKLVTFTHAGTTRIGAVMAEEVVDFSAHGRDLPGDMLTFLEQGPPALDQARQACASGRGRVALAEVRLEAPIRRPPKILAVGLNYRDHIEETGRPMPEVPMIFNKQSTAVTGPGGDIYRPPDSVQLDYEGELGFVIGKRCRRVPKEKAATVIAGYTIVNDVSVRDWQMRSATTTMGKSWDTHCPMGPYIVTTDEVPEPHGLELRTWVNGELRQHSNTRHLIFNCFDIVAHLSTVFTLEPGDVVATGTPSGVILGMDPKIWLKPGDVVRIAIDRLGVLENPVVDEPDSTVQY